MPHNYPQFEGAEKLRWRGFVNQVNKVPASVAAGIGYTILPKSGIMTFARADELSLAALTAPFSQELWLIKRAGRKLPAGCRWAEEEIKRVGADLCLGAASLGMNSVD